MASKPFSLRSAFDNDFTLTLAILVPFFGWGIYLLTIIIAGGSPLILYLSILATAISPFLLVRRLRLIRAFLEEGDEVIGKIHYVYFYSDRGRVQYQYTYKDVNYSGSTAVHKNERTLTFKDGQDIVLIVDRNNPQKSFVLDLYT